MKHAIKELLKGKEGALKGIGQKTIEIHRDKLYAGYVNKRNEVEEKLESADKEGSNQVYSEYRGLKEGQTFAANGQILHEYYFGVLGGDGKPSGELAKAIETKWGSIDAWKAEMTATGMAGRGWAVLAYDTSAKDLFVFMADAQNMGAVWGAMPVIAMDVYEHSYFLDYGSDRKTYIGAFFDNLDWSKANEFYKTATK